MMKDLLKRTISLTLSFSLVFTALPSHAFAVSNEEEGTKVDLSSLFYQSPQPVVQALNVQSAADFEFSLLNGRITAGDGDPLSEVSVSIYNTDEQVFLSACKTDVNGFWSSAEYDVIAGYSYIVSFYKAGYQFSSNDITCIAQGSATTLNTVTATKMDSFVCASSDFTYTVDAVSETATITGYTGIDERILLPETLGGYPVTAIGNDAFRDRQALAAVALPTFTVSVGANAFLNCASLENIYLPHTLTSIGNYAFAGCSALTELDLPDRVSTIGLRAFENCSSLTSFTYPRSLTSVGNYNGSFLFNGCTKLTGITVPEGVTTLPNAVFDGAASLTQIDLPTTLKYIGASAFASCSGLTEIVLPDSLLEIGNYAFNGCTGISQLVLPDSVTTIGHRAFQNCSDLTSINYPKSLTSTGNYNGGFLFAGCSKLTSITVPEGVTTLPEKVFDGNPSLQEIILPNSLKHIGASAFAVCTGLTEIDLPDGLLSIGNYAFNGCTGISQLTLPDSVTTLGHRAFQNCSALSSINYPKSLTSTGNYNGGYLFAGCEKLTSITVPEGVTTLPEKVFDGNPSLQEIILPSSLKHIGASAFAVCTGLTEIDLPDGLLEIGAYAFNGCTGISKLKLPDSITTIGHRAFQNCSELTSINYPKNLSSVGNYNGGFLFAGCSSLTTISVSEGVTHLINSAYQGSSSLKTVLLPSTLQVIGNSAFADCPGIATFSVPSNVTSIGRYAFASCNNLERIWIGSSVTAIDATAFQNCSGFTIHGVAGSFAETFATAHNIPFSTEELSYNMVTLGGKICLTDNSGAADVSVLIYNETRGKYVYEDLLTDANGTWQIEDAEVGCKYIVNYYKTGYLFTQDQLTTVLQGGSVMLDTVIASEIPGLVCVEGDFTYTVDSDAEAATITGYTGTATAILLPETLGGYPVTAISNDAFRNCQALTDVALSSSIASIGASAFHGCSALENVYLPYTLTSIGNYAFANCSQLGQLKLPDRVSTIGLRAFENCSSLTSFTYPRSLSSVGNYNGGFLFSGCDNLTSITVPDGVTSLPNVVFQGTASLTNVSLPSTLTHIGSSAFSGCNSLTGITLPDGLLEIGNYAFDGCTGISQLILPDSVTTLGHRAFQNCSELASINYPKNLSSAGNYNGGYLFAGCSKLTCITVPEGVTNLPEKVFDGNLYLQEITLPSTLKYIGGSAFAGCTGLTEIDLPAGLLEIGAYAFNGCTGISQLKLPDSVTTIGHRAFQNCSALSSINYPKNLSSVGNYNGGFLFAGCSSLTFITVPEGVTHLVNSAYQGSSSLQTVLLPNTLQVVGNSSFADCPSIVSFTVPSSVTSIGSYAFSACSNLERIWIGSNVTSIEPTAFQNCSDFTIHGVAGSFAEAYAIQHNIPFSTEQLSYNQVALGGKICLSDNSGVADVSVLIFNETRGKYVYEDLLTDANGAWRIENAEVGCKYIVSYYKTGYRFTQDQLTTVIGGSVMLDTVIASEIPGLVCVETDFAYTVDTNAEAATITGYTGSATAILLPETLGGFPVTAIAKDAFRGKKALIDVALSANITSIGASAFNGCSALESVYLPYTLTSIGNYAFANCSQLGQLKLPDRVSTIGLRAFENCSSLTSFTYPRSLSSVGNYNGGFLFAGCSNLKFITVPEGVTALPETVFQGAVSLTEVSLPGTLTHISADAFAGCNGLTEIDLPDGLLSIGNYAFNGCTAITQLKLPDSVTTIGHRAFQNCSQLASINYPKSLSSVGNYNGGYLFAGCSKLTSITVPEGVTRFPDKVFDGNPSLQEITLPSTLKYIGASAFAVCTGLTDLELPEGVLEIGAYAFNGCTGISKLKLPDSVVTIGHRAFQNCSALTSINYPKNLSSVGNYNGGYLFAGCSSLTSVTVSEGVTSIAAKAFQGSDALKTVYLPETVTTISADAFENCSNLRFAVLPGSLTVLGARAFANCAALRYVSITNSDCTIGTDAFKNAPHIMIICEGNSNAIMHAIENNIPFQASSAYTSTAPSVLDRANSYFLTDLNAMTANGYVTMTVKYTVNVAYQDQVHNKVLRIYLPANAAIDELTLKVDGELFTEYNYDGSSTLEIPVSKNSGVIKFPVKLTTLDNLQCYAALCFTQNGVKTRELIHYLNESVSALSLSLPSSTASDKIQVSGVAPASADITLSLDGEEKACVTAAKSGTWSATISLTEPKNYHTYTLTAFCVQDGKTLSQHATFSYTPDDATLTGFTMYYNEHNHIKSCDLLSDSTVKPKVYFLPGEQFDFEVTFDKPEQIDKLYVTSTRNNVVKYLEAHFDKSKNAFVTDGYFDENDPNYVPGVLNVEYTKKIDPVRITDSVDWSLFEDVTSKATEDTVQIKTATANECAALVDLGSIFKDLSGVLVDASISTYNEATDGNLEDWLGIFYSEADTIASYLVPGYNDEKYLVSLDYLDPYTWVMLVKDVSGNKYIKFTISSALEGNHDLTQVGKLTEISTTLSTLNTTANILLKQYQISKDMDNLRDEVWNTSYATAAERERALKMVDDLEYDQSAFYLITAVIPLIALAAPAVGATMTFAPIVFSAILGTITAIAPLFWQMRVAQIKGQPCRAIFVIDPSGYVYDQYTMKRLEGVTATAYFIPYDESDDFWTNTPDATTYGTLWDASEYNQENPISTNADGKYAWDVPEGWWRVKYELQGYETVWSDWLPVPPPQTEVNIGMIPLNCDSCVFVLSEHSVSAATVSVTNHSASAVNGCFILAAYDADGRMLGTSMVQQALASKASIPLSVSCAPADEIATVRGFVLDAQSYKPLWSEWVYTY